MFLLCLFVLVSRPVFLQRSSFWNCFLCSSATWRCWKLLGFLPGFHDGWCASFSVNSLLETDRPGCFVFLSWKGKLSLLTFVLILVMKTFLKESSSPCGSPERLEAVLHSSSKLKKKKATFRALNYLLRALDSHLQLKSCAAASATGFLLLLPSRRLIICDNAAGQSWRCCCVSQRLALFSCFLAFVLSLPPA